MQLKIIKNKEDLDFFRTKSDTIEKIDNDIRDLAKNLLDGLYKYNAIGVAGVMFGVHKRIIVVDLQEHSNKKPLVLINPEIIWHSEKLVSGEEASISIKNIRENVQRYESIKVKYLDLNGNECELTANGLLSRCIQHEIDYLDGKLFFDYLQSDRIKEIENTIVNLENRMKLKFVIRDDEILRQKSTPVEKIDKDLINTMNSMLEFMYESKGIGLAGVQIGVLKRIITIDLQENGKNPVFLINPEIIWHSENLIESEEGCLSVPGQRAKIKRFDKVKVKYLDINGKENLVETDGLFAICLQHEIDHLDGKLYIDYLSKLKRDLILSKVRTILKKM